MDLIELRREATRLLRDVQYLEHKPQPQYKEITPAQINSVHFENDFLL